MKIAGLLLALSACSVWGHGVEISTIKGGAGVSAVYSDGSPLAFAEVKVFAPGEHESFQEGMTDREGRFVFHPTTNGSWRIHLDDGMGHGGDTLIDIDPAGLPNRLPSPRRGTKASNILVGLGVIWGLFGTYGWYRAKRGR